MLLPIVLNVVSQIKWHRIRMRHWTQYQWAIPCETSTFAATLLHNWWFLFNAQIWPTSSNHIKHKLCERLVWKAPSFHPAHRCVSRYDTADANLNTTIRGIRLSGLMLSVCLIGTSNRTSTTQQDYHFTREWFNIRLYSHHRIEEWVDKPDSVSRIERLKVISLEWRWVRISRKFIINHWWRNLYGFQSLN